MFALYIFLIHVVFAAFNIVKDTLRVSRKQVAEILKHTLPH